MLGPKNVQSKPHSPHRAFACLAALCACWPPTAVCASASGSTVCSPCALPRLPVLVVAPVAVPALSQGSSRLAQVVPGPCSCSIFRGQVLPTWREMPLWLLALLLPLSLASTLAHRQRAGKGVAGTHGSVDLCHVYTRVQSVARPWLVTRAWGTGRESPGHERDSMAVGLCPSTHSTLAVPSGICVGLDCRRAAPGQCPLCPLW